MLPTIEKVKVLPLEGMIGMTAPAISNWYGNGFLNILIGDDYVGNVPIHAVRVAERGKRGAVEFEWRRAEGVWRVKFIALPNGKSIFCSVRCFAGPSAASWRLKLVTYPGRTVHDGERAVTTAKQTVKQVSKAALSPQDEYWLVCYDNVYDFGHAGSEGGGALIYAPEDVDSCEAHVTSYPVTVWLTPRGPEVRMVFWDSFFGQSNADIIDYTKRTAEEQLQQLRSMRFQHRALFDEAWRTHEQEIKKLLAALHNPQKESRRAGELSATLRRLRARLSDKPSLHEADDEPNLLKALAAQKDLLWHLRWEDLFRK